MPKDKINIIIRVDLQEWIAKPSYEVVEVG